MQFLLSLHEVLLLSSQLFGEKSTLVFAIITDIGAQMDTMFILLSILLFIATGLVIGKMDYEKSQRDK